VYPHTNSVYESIKGVEIIAFTLGFHITHAESSWAEAGSVELQATLQAELDTDA